MTMNIKKIVVIGIIVVAGFVLGRLLIRWLLNLLLGGTMFGGNILWGEKELCQFGVEYWFLS